MYIQKEDIVQSTVIRIWERFSNQMRTPQPYHMVPFSIPCDTFDKAQVRKSREEIRRQLLDDVFHSKDIRCQIAADKLLQYAGMKMTPSELAGRVLLALSSSKALQPGQLNDFQKREHIWRGIAIALTDDEQFQRPIVECLRQFDLSSIGQGKTWRGGTDSNR